MTSPHDFDMTSREPGNGPERCDCCGSRWHETGLCPLLEGAVEVEGEDTASIRAGTMTSNAGDVVQSAWPTPSSLLSIDDFDDFVTSGR